MNGMPNLKNTVTKANRGFSLLELLVVMTILVTVTGIIMTAMFQMSMSQCSVSNRTEMHASVRSATELLQQEIGQAGRVAIPTSLTPTAPVTITPSAVAGDGASHTVTISSTAGLFPGELLMIGPEAAAAGKNREPLFVTNLSATAITGVWMDPHA